MKPIVCVILTGVLVHTVVTSEPKQVNIALETVLRFDKNDQQSGLVVIDKVQDALEKIRDNLQMQNARRSSPRELTFAEFVIEAARTLMDYNDNDLEDVFAVIHDESRRYVNRESELQELFGSSDIRRDLHDQLDTIQDLSAPMLRRHLEAAITAVEDKEKTGEKNDIIDIGSYLYLGASAKFKAALRNLERLKTTKRVHIEDVIKDTLRSLIFDHYSNLNDKIKRELVQMAKDYWRVHRDKRDEYARKIKLEPRKVARSNNKRRNKHIYRHRYQLNAQKRDMSDLQSSAVHVTSSSEESSYKNKKYKNKTRANKERDFITTHTNFNNVNHRTDVTENNEETSMKWEFDDTINGFQHGEMELKSAKGNPSKSKSTPLTSQDNGPKFLQDTKEYKPKFNNPGSVYSQKKMSLKGGQHLRDIGSRPHSSFEKSYDHERTDVWKYEPDKTEEKRDEQALSDTVQEYHAEPFLSVERFRTENWPINDGSDSIRTSRIFELRAVTEAVTRNVTLPLTATKAIESAEGLAIESFEHKHQNEDKVIRKHIKHDVLNLEGASRGNMKKMIQNIEKEIEDVKEQVDYVKKLPIYKHHNAGTPKFKSMRSGEASSTIPSTSRKAKNYRYIDSESIERNNEEFFSRDILETAGTAKELRKNIFRAHGGSTIKIGTAADNNSNKTKVTAIKTTAAKATIATTHKVNVTSADIIVNSSSVNQVHKTQINHTANVGPNHNKTHNAEAIKNENFGNITRNDMMKLNEIDHRNWTTDKAKYDNFGLMPRRVLENDDSKNLPPELHVDNLELSDDVAMLI